MTDNSNSIPKILDLKKNEIKKIFTKKHICQLYKMTMSKTACKLHFMYFQSGW